MAASSVLRQHLLPLGGLTAGLALVPIRNVCAEEAPVESLNTLVGRGSSMLWPCVDREQRKRKPIYDEPSEVSIREIAASTPPPASGITERPSKDAKSTMPTRASLTDRLAAEIKRARLGLHGYATQAEDAVNAGMSKVLSVEKDFTTTVASLAPPKETNEKLLPGSIYVLVGAMAGSILARNRNILVRFVTPIITGVTTAKYVVPRTTDNVEKLIWSYEEKFPVIRDNHIRAQERVKHFYETGKAHSQMGLAMAEDRVSGVREAVKSWISQGR